MTQDSGATDSQQRHGKVKNLLPHELSPWASDERRAEAEAYLARRTAPAPEPEVRATPIEKSDPRMPGGAKQILNAAAREGWTHTSVTYSRGPIMHSTTREFLRMADFVIVKGARGRERFLASWVDGSFSYAYAGLRGERATKMNSSDLKARLKAT